MAYRGVVKFFVNFPALIDSAYSSREEQSAIRDLSNDREFKNFFGESVVQRVRERTAEGKSKTGSDLKPYKKSYTESFLFKIYSKSRKVNMELTGQMLSSMVHVPAKNGVFIQFDNEFAAAKAHGHITGANYLPVRDFFGLPQNELIEILKDTVRLTNSETLSDLAERSLTLPIVLSTSRGATQTISVDIDLDE